MIRSAFPTATWPETFPRAVAELDLDAPAFIEASAGTGKTYAIEHLVLRMCREKEWKPEEILVLSFTEKTTGELRDRVRTCFQRESSNPFWTEEERQRFFEAYLLCDEAAIHTLHGFCHSALRAHALENRALFSSELADDRHLLDLSLEGLLRGPWARDEARLHRFREALNIDAKEKWRRDLIQLALAYKPERGDALEPHPDPEGLARIEAQYRTCIHELEGAVQGLQGEAHRKNVFSRVRDAVEQGAALSAGEKEIQLSKFFLKKLRSTNRAVKAGFAACLSKKDSGKEKWIRLAEASQNLRETALRREEERELQRFGAMADAVRELRQRLDWEKRRRGVMSYDDMISRLVLALRRHSRLAEKIGRRYKACIVDEFQDTDPLQWELLQRLCLNDHRPIPLFLVGDPKQAIYSFRGGDLETYLEARQRMRQLSLDEAAQGFGLRENHRSSPSLIAALNAVFSHSDWFALAEESHTTGRWHLPDNSRTISFTPALAPSPIPRENGGAEEKSHAPILLHDFGNCATKAETQKAMQVWIASEIQKLALKAGPWAGGTEEAYKDIAVLTRSNFEAQAVEKHLRRKNIPCRVRRKGGVFEGPQADALNLLLDLLENAGDPKMQARILLLPFLRAGNNWPESQPEECPPLIQKWAALANAGRWPEFFHSLLFDSGYLYRLTAETRNGSEAQSLQTLCRALTEEGMRSGLFLRGMRERLDALRSETEEGTGDRPNSAAGEDGENRVTIMTLHMSKGLEFPVVFLAALGGSPKPSFYTLRETGAVFRHVLDKRNFSAQARYEAQARAEDKRLFYVGMTRAKNLLFVPLPPSENARADFGPLGGFAATALRVAAVSHPDLFLLDRESLSEAGTPALPESDPASSTEWPERDPWEEAGAFFMHRRRNLSSYSGLLRRESTIALEEDGARLQPEEGEIEEAPLPGETPVVEAASPPLVNELPHGTDTGNALHSLFENLDFAEAARHENAESWSMQPHILQTLTSVLARQGLSGEHAAAAGRIVWNTLHMCLPDPAGGEDFPLCHIAERRHEVEFLFPWNGLTTPPNPSTSSGHRPFKGAFDKFSFQNGFLWGFMDLVFRHAGRYYLLDWKSNFLKRYDAASIGESMREHRYALQYQLYSVALDKWLGARLPGYDPERHFGGLYYLYLRGASAGGPFSGFRHRPDARELRETYPARLRAALGLEWK